MDDKNTMDVTAIASAATDMQNQSVGTQIGVAVMKQVQDQEKQQAAALIQMIRQNASAAAAARGHVDVYA